MNILKIVRGNSFDTLMEVKAYRYDGTLIEDFDLHNCTDVMIKLHHNNNTYNVSTVKILDNNKIEVPWSKTLKTGTYSVEVTGKYNGENWRCYDNKPVLQIVETNSEANIPQNSIISEDYYRVDAQSLYIVAPKGETGPKGPKGDRGEQGIQGPAGQDGSDGADGHTPVITASKSNGVTTISVDGTAIATINDGIDGLDGANGQDAVSPTLATVATSGSYNDLSNKPTIPVIWSGTQAQYDALSSYDNNTIYIIS